MPHCKHKTLSFLPSSHASEAGYKQRTADQVLQATLITGGQKKQKPSSSLQPTEYNSSTFPAPLVLPGDELSFEPDYEPQTASDCVNNPYRNKVTDQRRTVYVVPVPDISERAAFVNDWAKPNINTTSIREGRESVPISKPATEDVVAYLQAFYHGVPVKVLEHPKLSFVPWNSSARKKPSASKTQHSRIGLHIDAPQQVFGIRHRPSKDTFYTGQLNLNDLLDVVISITPQDAYAVLLLTDHDLYEDEEDDFCCGRAYGGSRVAVVSWARYNPILDPSQEVETEHAWPASHCVEYMDAVCAAANIEKPKTTKVKKPKAKKNVESSAMHSALSAYTSLPPPTAPRELSNLWLGRFCKTASHELGHCFGIDHCVYFACVMQGTSGLTEDGGQPPYLCPVDLAKVLHATGATESQHCRAMLRFCEKFSEDKLFSAFAGWLDTRLREIEGPMQGLENQQ